MIDDNRTDPGKRASGRVFANDWVHGGADNPSVRRRLMAVLRLASAQLGMRRRHGLGMLGIGGALAAGFGVAVPAPALADMTVTPSGVCSRPGFGGPLDTTPWTCQVPTANGGFATVSNVPAVLGGVDLTVLDNWIASNLGTGAIALGDMTTSAAGANSVAIGSAVAGGDRSVAVGYGNSASADDSVAVGDQNQVSGSGATALGVTNTASGSISLAAGFSNLAAGDASFAVGGYNEASGTNSIAFGQTNIASGQYSTAVGYDNTASGDNTVALGNGNTVSGSGSSAVGMGNQASGLLSSAFGISNKATALYSSAFGNSSEATKEGSVAAGFRSFATGTYSAAFGSGAQASADYTLAVGASSTASALYGVALGGGSLADTALGVAGYNPTGEATPAGAVWNSTAGAVSVGNVAADWTRQITGVAAGTAETDAVNVAQLQAAQTHYYSVNDNGVAGGNYSNNGASGMNALAAGVNTSASGAGATAVGSGATANGAASVAIGQGATAGTANSVALGAGSTTAAAVGTAGTTINGVDYAFAGTAPVGTVSVGADGAERTITNVAAGQISATSTDAINGSQLHATNQAIEAVETGIGELNEFTVKYDTNPDGTKSNTVTLIGGDPNAPVLISNVAAGVKDTDAVNVGQLNEGLGNTLVEANSYTDNRTNAAIQTANSYTNQVAAQTLDQANAYTDYRFSQLNQDISAARTEARQGAAIGLAAASLRYDDRPGKASVAVGGGYWRGESAFAVGAGYTSENGRMRSNLSGATAGGDWGLGAGLSFTLN